MKASVLAFCFSIVSVVVAASSAHAECDFRKMNMMMAEDTEIVAPMSEGCDGRTHLGENSCVLVEDSDTSGQLTHIRVIENSRDGKKMAPNGCEGMVPTSAIDVKGWARSLQLYQ